jgi:hypothetical protein
MADITLTLNIDPKTRSSSIEEEALWLQKEGAIYYELPHRPLDAEPGCWVYFIRRRKLVARARAKGFPYLDGQSLGTFTGAKTDRSGWCVEVVPPMELTDRGSIHEGFQGFRYVKDQVQDLFESAFAPRAVTPDEVDRFLSQLTFDDDRQEPDRLRRGRLKAGWKDATDRKKVYGQDALQTFTWQNLGYRAGRWFGVQSDSEVMRAYECLETLFASAAALTFSDKPNIPAIAKTLDLRALNHPVGKLQDIRAKLKNLARRPGHSIFSARTTFEAWAFHHGGRTELQFNIGQENNREIVELRHGVAFSFGRSQTLPSIDVLLPKVKLFNDYILLNAEDFNDMRMWHYAEARSPDYMPGPIPADLVSEGIFVFLGSRQPADEIDYDKILDDFDRLLPLYE